MTVGKACPISLQPLGAIPPEVLEALCRSLGGAFGGRPGVLPAKKLPPTAWMAGRKQYDSTHLLLYLEASHAGADDRVLAVCDVDLASPIMTFVFGEAEMPGRFAVLSLHRLRPEVYGLGPDPRLFLERASKEAVHEMAHTFGLRHCYRQECIMHPSDTVERTDLKPITFCPRCASRLEEATVR